MKKILFLLALLPSLSFADRLGSLNPNSQVLLSTQNASAAVAGNPSDVQFNNGGVFGGNNGLQYDSSVSSITLGGKFGATVNSTSLLYDDSNGSGDPLLTLDDENGTPGGGLKFINQGVLSASWTNNTSEWDMAVSSGNSLSATNRMIFPKSDQNIKFLNANGSTYAEFNQLSNGVRNAEVITSSGTGQNLNIQVQGLPSGGHQNQIGGVTINNPDQNVPKALLVLVDSSTDQTSGDGLLELWENNPNHNSYLMWIHGDSNRNSDEPIRFDGPTYGIDEVSSSTDAAHGKGKWKVISIGNHETDLQIASPRAYDNTTFEQLLTASPFSVTNKPPGMYVNHSTLANDSGVLTSSDTGAVGFMGLNDSFVALTGPKLPAGSWSFSLPSTPNNAGQVLYQADNGRGGNNNARSWEFTTGGSTGQVLTYQSGSAPTWTTATGGGGGSSTLAVGTGTASNFTNNVTSPTAAISFEGAQFKSSALGTTNYISLNQSSVTLRGANISNGVTGAVQFSDGSGGFNSDDTNFHWDNSGKKLNLSYITTSGTDLTLEQTGDGYGTTQLVLENRFGGNGAVFKNVGLDLVDFGFQGNSGGQSNLRFEHRAAQVWGTGNSSGEFQFFDQSTSIPNFNVPLIVGQNTVSIGTQLGNPSTTKLGIGTGTPLALLHTKNYASTDKGIIIQGAASQSATLTEWQDSSSVVLSSITAKGAFSIRPRTKAQLSTDVPEASNLFYSCSDCVTDALVVSTGTAAGSFGRATSKTTAIN